MGHNRHITVAFLMAPVLALISYFAVDYMMSDPAKPAEKDHSYRLIEKPNCRYPSGFCELTNGDVKIMLTVTRSSATTSHVTLRSKLPLEGVTIALIEPVKSQESKEQLTANSSANFSNKNEHDKIKYLEVAGPVIMSATMSGTRSTTSLNEWRTELPYPQQGQGFRLVTAIAGSYYYGEVATAFIIPDKDIRNL